MKIKISFLIVGFGLVLISFVVVFFLYWKQTKESPFLFIYNDLKNGLGIDKVEEKYAARSNKLVESDILVLEESSAPTVLLIGSLKDYYWEKNPQTGDKELLVKILAEGKVVPFRVDSFSTYGREPQIDYQVNKITEDQEQSLMTVLEESKSGSPLISENYISIGSPRGVPQKKAYSKTQLLKETLDFFERTGRDSVEEVDWEGYFKPEGSFSVMMQVNYDQSDSYQ